MKLELLGWGSFFSKNFSSQIQDGYTIGRVAVEQKNTYILYTEFGELSAEVSGKMRHQASGRQPANRRLSIAKTLRAKLLALLGAKSRMPRDPSAWASLRNSSSS